MKSKIYFFFLTFITIIFCLAIGFDISPYLRGPAPYPPEWRWEYLFVNTFSKIYVPVIICFLIIGLYWINEAKNIFKGKTKTLLSILVIFSFLFQLSLLYFSRSGVSVLIHRIINPELNSYFTASLNIQNSVDFLKDYEEEMKNFVYHARSHPPGAILIFYEIKQIIAPFTFLTNFANNLSPTHADVKQIWNSLLPLDKATAIFSAFLIPFLSTLTIIPLYYSAKILYGVKVAIRSTFLFIFIPSIVFFIPINDVILPLFSITAFLFLLKGLQKNNSIYFFLSGLTLFLGAFISLAILPIFLLFFIFAFFYIGNNNLTMKQYLKSGIIFILGFILLPISLFIFLNFNFITLIQNIFQEVPHIHSRSYPIWIFYNLYDFFVFAGIPIAIIFFTQIKKFNKSNLLFISFLITLLLVDLSGSTRGEAGRIWAPFMPFIILPAVAFLTNQIKFSSKMFIGILLLQAIQILVMQEFWVMLW